MECSRWLAGVRQFLWSPAALVAIEQGFSMNAGIPELDDIPPDLIRFEYRLLHLAKALARGKAIIVAIGSSSTAGTGASKPEDWSYPARLEIELRQRLPNRSIIVKNQGVGGQEA